MENASFITELLGGKRTIRSEPSSDMDFIGLVRKGLPVQSAILAAKSLDLSEERAFRWLRISKRTAAQHKARRTRLRDVQSERLLRLVRMAAAATDVLGSREKAARWLQKPNRALGGEPPVELLDTGVGFECVMDVLRRIEHGVIG